VLATTVLGSIGPAFVAACGPGQNRTGDTRPAAGPPVALEFMLQGNAAALKATQDQLLPAFRAKHPNVTDVKLQTGTAPELQVKLQAQLATGAPPDAIRFTLAHFDLAKAGALVDLAPFVAKDKAFDLKDFYPAVTNYYRVPTGGLWALPQNYATESVFFNRSVLAGAGVPPPGDSWTWDDLLAAGRRIAKTDADAANQVWGAAIRLERIDPVLWSFGGGFLDDSGTKVTIGQPASIQALEFLADFVVRSRVQPSAEDLRGVQGGSQALFAAGRLGYQFGPERFVQATFNPQAGLDYDVAILPKGPNGRFNFFDPGGASVTALGNKRAAAYELVKWFVGDPDVIDTFIWQSGASPTAKISLNEQFWRQKVTRPPSREVMLKNPSVSKIPYYNARKGDELANLVAPALGEVWSGKRTAREVALDLQGRMTALLGT
jgi:multiple sugar transport system substrate-binding protein